MKSIFRVRVFEFEEDRQSLSCDLEALVCRRLADAVRLRYANSPGFSLVCCLFTFVRCARLQAGRKCSDSPAIAPASSGSLIAKATG